MKVEEARKLIEALTYEEKIILLAQLKDLAQKKRP